MKKEKTKLFEKICGVHTPHKWEEVQSDDETRHTWECSTCKTQVTTTSWPEPPLYDVEFDKI